MFHVRMAEHTFTVENRFPYVQRLCADYLTDAPGEPIAVTREEILRENQSGENFPEWYLESLAVYRKICEKLLADDVLLFHSSALALDGNAYLFAAPSGTGKSTHARLWRERFGKRVVMINDDKPLLHVTPSCVTVYGTPYGGKERLQTNCSAPVAGIVFLQQAKYNRIRRMTVGEGYPLLLNQTYRCSDPAGLVHTMDLVKRLSALPLFSLECTVSGEAAELAYRALTEKGKDTGSPGKDG